MKSGNSIADRASAECPDGGGILLSVIIVNWNTRDLLLSCLEHLQTLSLPSDTEVRVVDNGSSDGSAEAVRASFPDVHLIENGRNLGFAAANNRVLERCRGRYALLLNTDCFPEHGAVERLIEYMENDPSAGIVGGALIHPDGRRQNAFGVAPTLLTELFFKGALETLFPKRYPSKRNPPSGPIDVEAVLGAFLLARRKAWEVAGTFDEGYYFFLEETDWCLRMRRSGFRVVHVPNARAVHLQGESAKKNPVGARIEYHRSRLRFFSIHRNSATVKALRTGLLIKSSINRAFSGIVRYLPGGDRESRKTRYEVNRAILSWYLKGRPDHEGLKAETPVAASDK